MSNIVSINDLSKQEILDLLETASRFEANPNRKILDGKVIATLFFEPSTRTRLSFETAVNRLGGRIIGFSDPAATSTSKGESLKDTIKMVSNYVDLIVMRTPRRPCWTSIQSTRPRDGWTTSPSRWWETSNTDVPSTPCFRP